MDNERYKEWVENSSGLAQIEMLIMGNAEGLGLLDCELIEEFPRLKLDSTSEEDRLNKLRHIIHSHLWVLGAYELVRLIDELKSKNKQKFDRNSLDKLKEVLSAFTTIRVPLVKFEKGGKKAPLYSGVTTPNFDSIKGVGWKIYLMGKEGVETKVVYRRDLGDSLLDLLKQLNNSFCDKKYVCT